MTEPTTEQMMRHSHRMTHQRVDGEGFADWIKRADGCWDAWLKAHDAEVAANAWDEAMQALAWALNNGPADAAPAYVASHNPYRADRIEREATHHKPNPEEDPRG